MQKMAGTGFHFDVANRTQMCTMENSISRYYNRGLP
jgi:hypothetical protein